MIRIAHALRDENAAGAFRSTEALLFGMDRERFSLLLLIPEGCRAPVLSGASVLPLSPRLCEDPLALAALLRRLDLHVLHTHGWARMRLAGRIAGGMALVSTKHCNLSFPTRPRLYRAITDLTVATSPQVFDRMREAGIPEGELLLLENEPLPPAPISPAARDALRRKWGIGDRFAVGLCARLHPVKGHETLLGAAAALDRGFCFVLLGEGVLRPHLSRLAHRLGIADRVLFLGEARDPSPFYGAVDAHVSCSLESETSSLSLREGLAAGLPTAATDLPPNRPLPLSLFPVGDEGALASILLRFRKEGRRPPPHLPAGTFSRRMEEGYLSLVSHLPKRAGRFPSVKPFP